MLHFVLNYSIFVQILLQLINIFWHPCSPDMEQIKQLQAEAKDEFEKGLKYFKSYRKKFTIYSVVLIALYSTVLWFLPVPTLLMIPFSIGLGISLWHAVINEVYESKMVQGALSAIRYWTWNSNSSTS